MGKSRLDLQVEFKELLGSSNVYFQPPKSQLMEYDAIVYKRDNGKQQYADNKTYLYDDSYYVTVIYRHPDSDITRKIVEHFSMVYVERAGVVIDNLYHDYLKLYY